MRLVFVHFKKSFPQFCRFLQTFLLLFFPSHYCIVSSHVHRRMFDKSICILHKLCYLPNQSCARTHTQTHTHTHTKLSLSLSLSISLYLSLYLSLSHTHTHTRTRTHTHTHMQAFKAKSYNDLFLHPIDAASLSDAIWTHLPPSLFLGGTKRLSSNRRSSNLSDKLLALPSSFPIYYWLSLVIVIYILQAPCLRDTGGVIGCHCITRTNISAGSNAWHRHPLLHVHWCLLFQSKFMKWYTNSLWFHFLETIQHRS